MGKQSSRMIYRGKDHKDIYYHGHYHDAMYKGMELVWHKIRREGYYSIIIKTKTREMLVLIFSEKTGEFEEIMRIKNNTESPAYYIELLTATDSYRIYVSTLGTEDLIASSIDGIHFGNTNLTYSEVTDNSESIGPFENKSFYKDYMWSVTGGYRNQIFKRKISLNNGIYSYERKSYQATGYSYLRGFIGDKKSKLALCVRKDSMLKISSYDVEKMQGKLICELIPSVWEQMGQLFVTNETYIFFVQSDIKTGDTIYDHHYERYIYYSFGGDVFERSLLEESHKPEGMSSEILENGFPYLVCYREGIYYMYCNPGDGNRDTRYRVILTSDFKHFQTKILGKYIVIDGLKFSIGTLIFRDSPGVYFCNGERSTPEDGLLLFYETSVGPDEVVKGKFLCYIDNMFFRESPRNKYIELDMDF